jgi:hypothetical protein
MLIFLVEVFSDKLRVLWHIYVNAACTHNKDNRKQKTDDDWGCKRGTEIYMLTPIRVIAPQGYIFFKKDSSWGK